MNNQYFIIARDEDEPYIRILNKVPFEDVIQREYKNHAMLSMPPANLMEFPSNSVFIMCGSVISK